MSISESRAPSVSDSMPIIILSITWTTNLLGIDDNSWIWLSLPPLHLCYSRSRHIKLTYTHIIRANWTHHIYLFANIEVTNQKKNTIAIGQVQISNFLKHGLAIVQMLDSIWWIEDSHFWMLFTIILQEH